MISGSSVPAQPTACSTPESESCIRRQHRSVEDSTEDASCDAANNRPSVHPVDQYWVKVMAMRTAADDLKYKTLGKVVNGRPGTVTWKC